MSWFKLLSMMVEVGERRFFFGLSRCFGESLSLYMPKVLSIRELVMEASYMRSSWALLVRTSFLRFGDEKDGAMD